MFPLTSRFKLLDRPAALPGRCALCGAHDRAVVDFGYQVEFYGALYFCVDPCLNELATGLGYISAEKHEELQTRLAVADATQNAALTLIGEFYESQRRAMLKLSDDLAALRIPGLGVGSVAEGTKPVEDSPAERVSPAKADERQASDDAWNEGPFSISAGPGDEFAEFGLSVS